MSVERCLPVLTLERAVFSAFLAGTDTLGSLRHIDSCRRMRRRMREEGEGGRRGGGGGKGGRGEQ